MLVAKGEAAKTQDDIGFFIYTGNGGKLSGGGTNIGFINPDLQSY